MNPAIRKFIDDLGDRVVMVVEFGSRLYGTSVPTSDYDYKAIMLPTAEEILLGTQAAGASFSTNPKDSGVKNGPDDAEIECFSLYRYLELLCEGQTVALDMLFAPAERHIVWTPLMERIWACRDKLVNRNCSAAIGYAKSQAEKYSLRGDRMEALRTVLNFLKTPLEKDHRMTLAEALGEVNFWGVLDTYAQDKVKRYIKVVREEAPNLPDGHIMHLEVCGKKAGFTSSVRFAHDVFTKMLGQYGARAKAALNADGVDWKAQYHALRVSTQTVELLTTGAITFPRPDADLLLRVRTGAEAPQKVSAMIEDGVEAIYLARDLSKLREKPDLGVVRDLVRETNLKIIQDYLKKVEAGNG